MAAGTGCDGIKAVRKRKEKRCSPWRDEGGVPAPRGTPVASRMSARGPEGAAPVPAVPPPWGRGWCQPGHGGTGPSPCRSCLPSQGVPAFLQHSPRPWMGAGLAIGSHSPLPTTDPPLVPRSPTPGASWDLSAPKSVPVAKVQLCHLQLPATSCPLPASPLGQPSPCPTLGGHGCPPSPRTAGARDSPMPAACPAAAQGACRSVAAGPVRPGLAGCR